MPSANPLIIFGVRHQLCDTDNLSVTRIFGNPFVLPGSRFQQPNATRELCAALIIGALPGATDSHPSA